MGVNANYKTASKEKSCQSGLSCTINSWLTMNSFLCRLSAIISKCVDHLHLLLLLNSRWVKTVLLCAVLYAVLTVAIFQVTSCSVGMQNAQILWAIGACTATDS